MLRSLVPLTMKYGEYTDKKMNQHGLDECEAMILPHVFRRTRLRLGVLLNYFKALLELKHEDLNM